MPTAHCSPLPQTGLCHVRLGRPFECCLARDDASPSAFATTTGGGVHRLPITWGCPPHLARHAAQARTCRGSFVSSYPIHQLTVVLLSHDSTGGNRADHHPPRRIGVFVSERDINLAKTD
ncbi:hypothetical protein OPV22_028098 [Ensete ventricosum]|nr:hypothetical protein OPV22_028098 [Ensete ventricosum]